MLKAASLLTVLAIARLTDSAVINDTYKSSPNVYQAQGKPIRACYYTNWAQWRPGRGKYVAEDYEQGLCTHILFAFAKMAEDSSATNFESNDIGEDGMYTRVNALKKKDPGLKTLLSFGGWSMGSAPFEKLTANPANKKKFVDSTIAFVRKWGFDGIDIDWEYPSAQQKAGYVDFISALRTAIDAESSSPESRLLLTAAVPAGQSNIDPGYDVEKLAKLFDFVLVMTYDFHGGWESKTGFNSPLYAGENESPKTLSTDFAAKYWNKKGMPKEKIVVGIATYGRGWTLQDPSNDKVGAPGTKSEATEFVRDAGTASYYEICELEAKGAKVVWDDVQKVPYLVSGNQWYGYDNVKSISIKMDWIKENGFAGAFVWTLDFDDFNGKCSNKNGNSPNYPLIRTIAEKLGGVTFPGSTPAPIEGSTEASTTSSETLTPVTEGSSSIPISTVSSSIPISTVSSSIPISTVSSSIPISTVSSSMTTSGSLTTVQPGEFKCTEDGYFPDKDDCEQFFRCVGDRKFTFKCANGTSFHSDTLICDHMDCSKCAGKKMESCGAQLE